MNRIAALVVTAAATHAIAAPPPPSANALPPEELQRAIILRSPHGQFAAGVRRGGIFDVLDGSACSRWAIDTILGRLRDPPAPRLLGNETVIDRVAPPPGQLAAPMAVAPLAASIRKELADAYAALSRSGDALAAGRHVCVGMASYAQANAESFGLGFMLFDPQLWFDLNRFAGRSMRTGTAIVLHELAHQLQYWSNDPVLADKTVAGERYARRSELQADCVAAALVAQTAPEIAAPKLWATSRPGILTAFRQMGDFSIFSSNHHGLLNERHLAAEYGVRLVEKRGAAGSVRGLSGHFALDSCRTLIDAMDKKYGKPWPITARLP